MHPLWVEDYVISCYNHPERGDYNNEALNFKIAAARFLDVSEEETNKMKERKCSGIYSRLSNYTNTINFLRLSEYC